MQKLVPWISLPVLGLVLGLLAGVAFGGPVAPGGYELILGYAIRGVFGGLGLAVGVGLAWVVSSKLASSDEPDPPA